MLAPNEDRTPAYFRIKKDIVEKIQQHEWLMGMQLPTEPKLQTLYGQVSRGTVRRALLELEMEGYIRRQQGRGTFVARLTPRIPYQLGETSSFSQQVREAGLEPTTQLLESGLIPAIKAEGRVLEAFDLSEGGKVFRIRRLRLGNGMPMAVQTVFLLPSRCPGILDEDFLSLVQLYREKYGVRITTADEILRVVPPKDDETQLLESGLGMHVIRDRISYDQNGDPFEVLHSVEAEDKFEYRYRIVEDETQILKWQEEPTNEVDQLPRESRKYSN